MILMMTMRARALAAVSWLDLVPLETRQSPYDGHGGLRCFFGVKLELDFHCPAAVGGTNTNLSKYEEEQY
jgi:hypothetical protein